MTSPLSRSLALSSLASRQRSRQLATRRRLSSCQSRLKDGVYWSNAGALPPSPPPVTLLAGFLGAGKTTTLTHVLNNRAGLNVAVIVNDVASVNIDGATVRAQIEAAKQQEGSTEQQTIELLELENGCVCCGPQAGKLADSIKALVAMGEQRYRPFDHVVVEMSGVADPSVVRANLSSAGIDVNHIVTLVDTPAFAELWMDVSTMENRTAPVPDAPAAPLNARYALATPTDLEHDRCAVHRRVVSLLLAQIESADVVLLNKADLSGTDELATAEATTSALTSVALGGGILGDGVRQTDAKLLRTAFGNAPLEMLLPLRTDVDRRKQGRVHEWAAQNIHGRVDGERTVTLARSLADGHATAASATHDTVRADQLPLRRIDTTIDGLGIDSFVFTSTDRPMDDQRLQALIQRWAVDVDVDATALELANLRSGGGGALASPWKAVLRSKGTLWLKSKYNSRCEWSFAGRNFTLVETGNEWESPESAAERESGDWGQRKTELVVIGLNLDKAALRADLEACLLQDMELAEYEVAVYAAQSQWRQRRAHRNPTRRFNVGETVECYLGSRGGWARGQVVAHDFRLDNWEADKVMAYQVQLCPELGLSEEATSEQTHLHDALVFAPVDADTCIRAHSSTLRQREHGHSHGRELIG